jgi:NAD(P)-dependent dehydrogenase (short-subunit alcohol dehydrogenase family)
MSNPVVLITGGLTGIGRAAAVAFAKKGAKVVVAGRRDEAGKALVKELRSFGSEAEFINADVRKEDDVRALVDKTVARFGRLDVAVNNAATEGQVGPITDQTAESFAATFETNVLGVVLSMKHEVREHPKRPIDHLSRCGPWRVIPGSEALRGARRDVPGRMTFHDVGLHQYTGREIEGVENHDRSP